MEPDLLIRFPGRVPYAYSFVQGEDRQMELLVLDRASGKAFDLTGAVVTLHLPRDGGGSLKRYSAATRVPAAQVVPAASGNPGSITLPAHGLVNGDTFTVVAAGGGGALPGGLAISTPYLVKFLTEDTFSIQTAAGADVTLSTAGTVGFDLTLADGVTNGGASGDLVFTLSSVFTKGVQSGAGQSVQLDLLIAGKRRAAQQLGALTVFSPVDP